MSANLHALRIAIDVAARQRDAARQMLLDMQRTEQAAQAQLGQLQGYSHETEGRWGMRANATRKPEVLLHHRHFMARLDYAIGLQTQAVGEHTQRVDNANRALLAAQLRLASLEKLLAKRLREQEQAATRREQKHTDERAALQFAHRHRPS